jgi:hypothetical protein
MKILAAVILPLLAASSPILQASAILPSGGFSCSATADSGSPTCPIGAGASQLNDPGNGIQGAKLYTGSAVNFLASSSASLDLFTQGPLTGTIGFGVVIPISWNFTIEMPVGAVNFWSLFYTLSTGEFDFASARIGGSGAGTFSGTGSMTTFRATAEGETVRSDAKIILSLSTPEGAPQSLSVTVPANSFDFNSVPSSSVPEPSSVAMFGLGLALLVWRLVSERKRRPDVGSGC